MKRYFLLIRFRFDGAYGSDTTQEDFFNNEVAPIVNTVFKGINTTIFAYGITGAGNYFRNYERMQFSLDLLLFVFSSSS